MALTKAQLVDLNANELIIDLDADTSITADTDDQIDIKIAGADDFRFTANTFTALSGSTIAAQALTATTITTTGAIAIANDGNIGSAGDADAIAISSAGVVTFSQSPVFPDGSLAVADLDIDGATDIGAAIVDADLFIVDDGAGGTNRKVTASRIKTYAGFDGAITTLDIDGATDIGADIADADLFIIDDGAGGTNRKVAASRIKTYIGASTAADDLTIGDAAVTLSTSSGNITIDATANDTDIIFKGTDNNSDITMLTLDGSAAGDATFNNQVIVGDGKLVLNSTAVTSTAAEINLIDGGTSRGTTAVATGDGILINDGGTMRMTNVDTVSTYFAGHSVGGANIVTTGALDSGSITSGFGAIDNGTSNIRSATITAETAFVPDAANGASLGSASLEFADLFLHDGAQILFGADQDVVLTHAADAGLTLKTATTSDDTKATLTLQTGDTDIAANDVLGQLHFQAPDEAAGTDAILVAAGIAAISEGDFSASNNATKLSFQTGASEAASERMSISSTGATTITVADNSDTLTLKSTDADANVGPVLALHRDSGSPADNDIIGRIDFRGDNDAGEAINYASIFGKPSDITDGTEDVKLIVAGMKAGTSRNLLQIGEDEVVVNEDSVDTDFRVESNGNDSMIKVDAGNNRVGIGTGTPGGDFEVKMNTNVRFVVDDTQDSLTTLKSIQDNDSKNGMRIICDNLNVETNTGSNTNVNRLTVSSGGEVSINDDGAETGATVFKVKGALNNTPAIFEHRNSSGSQTMILFRDGAIDTCGTIGIAPASNTVSYNTSSDYRLKENVDYDFDATSRLKQLKPARFNWIKDETNTLVDGFLAHEVSSIVPEAIQGEKDAFETYKEHQVKPDDKNVGDFKLDENGDKIPLYQGIDQSKLVPLLVKTIQELEARIKTLEDA